MADIICWLAIIIAGFKFLQTSWIALNIYYDNSFIMPLLAYAVIVVLGIIGLKY